MLKNATNHLAPTSQGNKAQSVASARRRSTKTWDREAAKSVVPVQKDANASDSEHEVHTQNVTPQKQQQAATATAADTTADDTALLLRRSQRNSAELHQSADDTVPMSDIKQQQQHSNKENTNATSNSMQDDTVAGAVAVSVAKPAVKRRVQVTVQPRVNTGRITASIQHSSNNKSFSGGAADSGDLSSASASSNNELNESIGSKRKSLTTRPSTARPSSTRETSIPMSALSHNSNSNTAHKRHKSENSLNVGTPAAAVSSSGTTTANKRASLMPTVHRVTAQTGADAFAKRHIVTKRLTMSRAAGGAAATTATTTNATTNFKSALLPGSSASKAAAAQAANAQAIVAATSELTIELQSLQQQHNVLMETHSSLEQQHSLLQHESQTMLQQLTHAQALNVELQQQLQQQATRLVQQDAALSEQSAALSCALSDSASKTTDLAQAQQQIRHLHDALSAAENRARFDEQLRRKQHNQIQELKGNIRVVARVRPALQAGAAQSSSTELAQFAFPPHMDHRVMTVQGEPKRSVDGSVERRSTHTFEFDYAFEPQTSQESVYAEVSQLIQSLLDGYNVTLLAYGQTGSGKTWTMEGDISSQANRGIIPRSIDQIFGLLETQATAEFQYSLTASFFEIYCEQIKDLLVDPVLNKRTGRYESDPKAKCEVKLVRDDQSSDPQATQTIVQNLSIHEVTSRQQLHALLVRASRNRAQAATDANASSSRSHSLVQLTLHSTHRQTGERKSTHLSLVDLAGSERDSAMSKDADAERKVEMRHINKSLSALAECVSQLAAGNRHVSYRNSKLTHVLQKALEAPSSKVLLLVALSPDADALQETLCSLRFARQVAQVHLSQGKK